MTRISAIPFIKPQTDSHTICRDWAKRRYHWIPRPPDSQMEGCKHNTTCGTKIGSRRPPASTPLFLVTEVCNDENTKVQWWDGIVHHQYAMHLCCLPSVEYKKKTKRKIGLRKGWHHAGRCIDISKQGYQFSPGMGKKHNQWGRKKGTDG